MRRTTTTRTKRRKRRSRSRTKPLERRRLSSKRREKKRLEALKAKQELETQEMEAKIAREEIQEEEEEEDGGRRRDASVETKVSGCRSRARDMDALDKANEEAIAMLNRHDEKDDNKGEDSLEEVDEDGNEVMGKTSQFSMSLGNKGMFYDEEADKELIEDDPAIKAGPWKIWMTTRTTMKMKMPTPKEIRFRQNRKRKTTTKTTLPWRSQWSSTNRYIYTRIKLSTCGPKMNYYLLRLRLLRLLYPYTLKLYRSHFAQL